VIKQLGLFADLAISYKLVRPLEVLDIPCLEKEHAALRERIGCHYIRCIVEAGSSYERGDEFGIPSSAIESPG
jgi:hypothetical protein